MHTTNKRLFIITPLMLFGVISTFGVIQTAHSSLLYSASLKDGNYGGGFIVDTFTSCSDPDGSSCGDGDLSEIGITDTSNGVSYTNSNAVINYSLGRDGKGGSKQSTFRTTGTASVSFKADLRSHASGQPFVDNYGFNQFHGGQGTFGTGMSRNTGGDGTAGTSDDMVSIGWSTWHSGVWHNHATTAVLASYDQWHDLGFAWGGPGNVFEIWLDGVLMSSHTLPGGVTPTWGSSGFLLGSAYNFALGEIHERPFGNSTTHGVMFADLEIWDEYRANGATARIDPPVPEPATALLMGLGLAGLALRKKSNK